MDKRKERTRRAIQQAFVELIAERGFSDVTVQDILDRTGEGSEKFADCLRHEIVKRADEAVPEHPTGPAAQMNRTFLLHHIAASFVGMVRWWAWTGFAAAPHDLAKDYLRAILPVFGDEPPA